MAAVSLGVVPTAASDPPGAPRAPRAPTATDVASSTTSTTPAPAATVATLPPTTTTSTPPTPAPSGVPPYGQATAWGCGPALAYLQAYAAPGFAILCPGDAEGHEAMSCYNEAPCPSGQRVIAVAEPCAAAYMNEAHNSWVLLAEVQGTPIPDGNPAVDPYGHC